MLVILIFADGAESANIPKNGVVVLVIDALLVGMQKLPQEELKETLSLSDT